MADLAAGAIVARGGDSLNVIERLPCQAFGRAFGGGVTEVPAMIRPRHMGYPATNDRYKLLGIPYPSGALIYTRSVCDLDLLSTPHFVPGCLTPPDMEPAMLRRRALPGTTSVHSKHLNLNRYGYICTVNQQRSNVNLMRNNSQNGTFKLHKQITLVIISKTINWRFMLLFQMALILMATLNVQCQVLGSQSVR